MKIHVSSWKILKQEILALSEPYERSKGEKFFIAVYKIGYLKPKVVFKLHLV